MHMMEDEWHAQPEQTDVEEHGELLADHPQTEKVTEPAESQAHSDSSFERCLHCLSHVPCSSLIAWIALLLGLGGVTGSLLVATDRTRELLEDERMLWFVEYMTIGVTVGMFVMVTCLLVVGYFSSKPNSRHVFNTSAKITCVRGLNIFMLVLSYILTLAWIFASAILIIPVAALVLLIYLRAYKHITCINLQHYGFDFKDICNENLERFIGHTSKFLDEKLSVLYTDRDYFTTDSTGPGRDLLICYIAAYVSSVIIIISLVHFLMCISANITHLRDVRFATLNAYEEEAAENEKLMNDTTI